MDEVFLVLACLGGFGSVIVVTLWYGEGGAGVLMVFLLWCTCDFRWSATFCLYFKTSNMTPWSFETSIFKAAKIPSRNIILMLEIMCIVLPRNG